MQQRGRGIELHPMHLKATFFAFLSIHLIFKAWLRGIFCATIIGIVPGFVCSPRDKGEAVGSRFKRKDLEWAQRNQNIGDKRGPPAAMQSVAQ